MNKSESIEGMGGKLFRFGLPQHNKHAYGVDSEGNVVRVVLGTPARQFDELAEVFIRQAVPVIPGFIYYVDSDGDVVGAPDRNYGKKPPVKSERQLAAEAREDQALKAMFEGSDGLYDEVTEYLNKKYEGRYPPLGVPVSELEAELREVHARLLKERDGG
ncbi:MAG: hypothetical protein JKY61_07165 [Planctomycetes bacterium]|nr:hypothetical protein [Planctomycetota bacterium]